MKVISRNAYALVRKLKELGITIHGQEFHIVRHHGQPMMNKAAGECAPCWELRVDPVVNYITRKIVVNGTNPTFDMPNGVRFQAEVFSHMPLTHILKTPVDKWDVDIDEYKRLYVGTTTEPESWK
ncbi:hypothetical protein LCGC14_0761700 [marine sediment metagenome]|uniref:Uncharacterized protein n=1 Tax=marine sediment metagenome TaxID=412755 RepID=A0A0F9SKX0_9ZZZZ|nr:hypothetical protein [bacterium]